MATRNLTRGEISLLIAAAVAFSSAASAGASDHTRPQGSAVSGIGSPKQRNIHLTEGELEAIGLSRQGAKVMMEGVESHVRHLEDLGEISGSDAKVLLDSLTVSRAESHHGGAETRALPAWAAGAIVGCAGRVVLGEGKEQVKNLLKEGKSTDEISDVMVGSAVDCVFGAVSGGALAAPVKKSPDAADQEHVEACHQEGDR